MKAVVNKRRQLAWFDGGSSVADPAAVTGKLYLDGQLVGTIASLDPDSTFPDLYCDTGYLFTSPGTYSLVILEDGTALDRVEITVSSIAGPDILLGATAPVSLAKLLYTGVGEPTAYTRSPSGVVAGPYAAPLDNATASYVVSTAAAFLEEGAWQIVWEDTSAVYVQDVWVGTQPGKELVNVIARSSIAPDSHKYVGATVIASDTNGVQLAVAVTGADGGALMQLAPGEVVFSLVQDGVVFSSNNFHGTVTSTAATPAASNVFPLVTDAFYPTVTTPTTTAAMCELYATLFGANGVPLRYTDINITVIGYPLLASGAMVVGTTMLYRTDSNGYVSFQLAQGAQVEIGIAAAALRRVITVPSGNDAVAPVNLLTLVNQNAFDVFAALTPTLPAAVKRTL